LTRCEVDGKPLLADVSAHWAEAIDRAGSTRCNLGWPGCAVSRPRCVSPLAGCSRRGSAPVRLTGQPCWPSVRLPYLAELCRPSRGSRFRSPVGLPGQAKRPGAGTGREERSQQHDRQLPRLRWPSASGTFGRPYRSDDRRSLAGATVREEPAPQQIGM